MVTVIAFTWLAPGYCKLPLFLIQYYAYSPVLLLIPLVSFITYILFVGRLDQEVLESVMMHALNTYDAVNKSREAWDATQTHVWSGYTPFSAVLTVAIMR